MKGKLSSKDETKLSFQVVVYDSVSKKMTVRECLWNVDRGESGHTFTPAAWGETATVDLSVPSAR